jgi:hypothetical protein
MIIQEISLWHFMYVLYPELVHPLHCSPFYLSPILMVISSGLNVLFSFLYRKCINHIHLLYFFIYASPPITALLLAWPILHFCPSLFRFLFMVQWNFYFDILPINVLCISQSDPFHCTSSPFFPYPVLFNSFQSFLVFCSYTYVMHFFIIH